MIGIILFSGGLSHFGRRRSFDDIFKGFDEIQNEIERMFDGIKDMKKKASREMIRE